MPPRCYLQPSGKVAYCPKTGGKITFHDLGTNPDADAVWKEYRAIISDLRPSGLQSIYDEFKSSKRYERYKQRTKKDHERYITSLKKVFGNSDMSKAQPVHIEKWLNRRAETAHEQANKELSFLRIVLDYGIVLGVLRTNPAREVKKLPLSQTQKRDKLRNKARSYVDDDKYDRHYARVPLKLKVAMELFFCLGVRLGDLLRIKISDVQYYDEPTTDDNGVRIWGLIDIDEGKGINKYSRCITDRVNDALNLLKTIEGTRSWEYLIHNQQGKKYTEDGFGTIWQYWRTKAPVNDRFGVHSLRAKAISDWQGNRKDKWMFSRHKSETMVDVYDLSKKVVPSHDHRNKR